MPQVRTLFCILSMIATIVDWTWANSLPIEPVESTQKQISMKPKAGRGRLSLDFVLKTVALLGFIDLSMLRALIMVAAVVGGGGREAGDGKAGNDERAALEGTAVLLVGLFAALGLVALWAIPLGASSSFPYQRVRAIVRVFTIFLSLRVLRKSWASATHFYMELVRLGLAGTEFLELLFAIEFYYYNLAYQDLLIKRILTHSEFICDNRQNLKTDQQVLASEIMLLGPKQSHSAHQFFGNKIGRQAYHFLCLSMVINCLVIYNSVLKQSLRLIANLANSKLPHSRPQAQSLNQSCCWQFALPNLYRLSINQQTKIVRWTLMKSSISDNYNILMFPAIFWVKYIFRVMHIGSLVVICQAVIQAKLNGDIVKTNPLLYMLSGIFVIASGLVNTYLLSPKDMGDKRKLWLAYNHFKALTAIVLFTPLVKLFPMALQTRIDLQFYWMVFALLLSPFARFYREHFAGKEKEKREKEIREEDSP